MTDEAEIQKLSLDEVKEMIAEQLPNAFGKSKSKTPAAQKTTKKKVVKKKK
jgi:hypothetical protein